MTRTGFPGRAHHGAAHDDTQESDNDSPMETRDARLFGLTASEMSPVLACLRAAAMGLLQNTNCDERTFAALARTAWRWERDGQIPKTLEPMVSP